MNPLLITYLILHIHIKKSNVFVAIFPAATYGSRLMIWCAVIKLLVWLLNCCVVTELTKKLFQIQIQTILEIESQMTLDLV